jgi:hypothetical protein
MAGFDDLSQVSSFPEIHFLTLKGFGRKSLLEIRKILGDHGLAFPVGRYALREPDLSQYVPMPPQQATPQSVYFIQPGEIQVVKIGICTGSPGQRMASLQTGCWEKLRILGTLDGGRPLELELHHKFHNHHIRGEWFRLDADIVAYIRDNCE